MIISACILFKEPGEGGDRSFVVARPDFQFMATMNPGGEFGKKEVGFSKTALFRKSVPGLCGVRFPAFEATVDY